ncbi:MAG: hemolysin family protein, partial [Candidatus Promineifilaceae bacterium]
MPDIFLELVILAILLLINGVFAMSEIAVVSARPARLQHMAAQGSQGAAVALELAASPTAFLSTVQVGITLVGIFAGAFGGAALADELALPLSSVPVIGPYAGPLSFLLVVGTITFFSVVIGELVPKRIALGSPERIAAAVARPMNALSVVASPVVRVLSATTNGILALLGVDSAAGEEVSEEEIKVMVQQSAQAGVIEEAERDMVERIFRFGDQRLESMMTPRPEIFWLDINASEEETRAIIRSSNHDRFPVCDGDMDHVLGVVRAKDLLLACLEDEPFDLRAAMKEPVFAPEQMQALSALERFKQTGTHMALLVDEYGGIEGLVTLIDLLEAIVGDIPTVDEITEPPIVKRADGSCLVEGMITVEDFKEAFELRALPGEGK